MIEMAQPIEVKVHESAGTIVLNHPEKRNALSRKMMEELGQALEDLHLEKRVRAVILTGAGSAFCAGMDLDEMRETAEMQNAEAQWGQDAEDYRDLMLTMLRFPKPIIAAVNGPAVAGGMGLLLAADIVIGCPDARVGLPEPRRGIVAGLVAPLLVFRIGGGQAARMLLTSELFEAEEAYRIGLIHQMAPTDKIWAQSVEIVRQCEKGAPESLQLTKRLLNEMIGEHLTTHLATGAAASATARTTEAAVEGLAAFQEKREAKWP